MFRLLIILPFLLLISNLMSQDTIRYAAIGDSYTICEGMPVEQRWPNILTKHLNEANIPVKLVANPSVTGWTSQQALDFELPIYRDVRPDFATLLIGVNDWVQEVPAEDFTANLEKIMDQMLLELDSPKKLIVVTIPDFGVTPTGSKYSKGRNISEGIALFNAIVQAEARKRNLVVVDIFETTQKMGEDASLIHTDGLHPSAKEYAIWEQLILPHAIEALK